VHESDLLGARVAFTTHPIQFSRGMRECTPVQVRFICHFAQELQKVLAWTKLK